MLNSVTGTLVGTGLAASDGDLTGFDMHNTPSREMAVDMSQERNRGSGNWYQRNAAFERDFGKKYDLRVKSVPFVAFFVEPVLLLVALL